ncbi:restriction endonuclease subunit S [Chryseobacterium sp. GMJ5]|uniref:Restriction endonuclease subunit S n=1 Tax=Chryseobacterium gilvum TaxID=2976534 RepID=A0ABT2VV87_9FLAO|nr:restriction endonuclease subunit S [Chryseobacterium gilvum]MCU7613916.1 restriction endonuclease subunit S [Chryseobacterium gilvum]
MKNLNFPNLRFPGFYGEWEMKKIGEVAEIKTGNKDTQNKVENGIYPFFVRSNSVEKINSYSYDGEAILTSGDGVGVGKNFHYINGRFDFHQRVYSIRNFKEGFDGKYIYSIFSEKFYDRVMRLSAKNSVDSVRMSMISEMKLSFPMLSEQQKIASFLSFINERIITQKKIIEDLQITKKIISTRLFNKGFSYIDNYNFKRLGDLTYVVNKKNKKNLKLPVYSINNKKGFVKQSVQFEGIDSDERGYDISLYKIIDKKTFAYNPARINVGSIGYNRNLENIIISSLYVCFKTTEEVNDEFLFQYLKTDLFKKDVLRNVEGGVRDYLFYENFSRIKVNLPNIDIQNKIANFLKLFDEKLTLENELLTNYENQKKYLLANLFV